MHGNDDKTAYRESNPVTAWLVLLADCVLSQHWTEPVEQDWLGEGAGVLLGAGAGAGVATARMARDIATATLKNIVDREEWEGAEQLGGLFELKKYLAARRAPFIPFSPGTPDGDALCIINYAYELSISKKYTIRF